MATRTVELVAFDVWLACSKVILYSALIKRMPILLTRKLRIQRVYMFFQIRINNCIFIHILKHISLPFDIDVLLISQSFNELVFFLFLVSFGFLLKNLAFSWVDWYVAMETWCLVSLLILWFEIIVLISQTLWALLQQLKVLQGLLVHIFMCLKVSDVWLYLLEENKTKSKEWFVI